MKNEIKVSSKIKFTLLAFCITIIAVCGYKMYALADAQKLWEWWTFPFLCALWGAIVLIFLKKYNLRRLLLSTLSGFLFVIGFPPHSFPLTLFFAFVPLLIISKELSENSSTIIEVLNLNAGSAQNPKSKIQNLKSSDGIFKYAFNAFVIFNIGVTWWVANAGLIAGMIANYLNAFFMATAFWLFHKLRVTLVEVLNLDEGLNTRLSSIVQCFIFISFWIGFEYLHLNWDISWTWLTLGNAFAERNFMIQWYDVTGVFGGTIWILVTNYLIYKIVRINMIRIESGLTDKRKKNSLSKKLLILFTFSLFIIPVIVSLLRTPLFSFGYKLPVSVVVVQPNFEPHYQKFNYSEEMQLQKFLRLASEKVDSTTDYLVFPETSFNLHNMDTWHDSPVVQALKKFVSRYPKLHLITGVEGFKTYAQYVRTKPVGLEASSIRTFKNPDGSFTYWEVYNAAIQFSNDTTDLPLYKKSKFVPGPELLPYPKVFGFLIPLFEQMGGSANGLGAQPERSVFENKQKNFKVGPVVCYESIFGDFCTGYVKKGADALFIVTNDGWWGDTPGYQQHLDFARLRAIELRIPVVRSANTGASCFIDASGEVFEMTKYGVDAVIQKNISGYNQLTFYAQHGDYLGKIFAYPAVLLLFLTLSLIVRKRIKK